MLAPRAQSEMDSILPQRAPALGNNSRIAARLEEDNGSVNVLWNLVAMDVSSVNCSFSEGRRCYLLMSTLLACFSGYGSRKQDLAARRSLRLGTDTESTQCDLRSRGGDLARHDWNGSFIVSMNSGTVIFGGGGVDC